MYYNTYYQKQRNARIIRIKEEKKEALREICKDLLRITFVMASSVFLVVILLLV